MKPLSIDFAASRNPWRWDWRMPGTWIFMVLVFLALVTGALTLLRGQQLGREVAHVREELAQLQSVQEKAATVERQQAGLGQEEAALLRQSERQRALPWEAIFRAFEAVPTIKLQAFEPDLVHGVIKVQAQATDVAALQGYLRALQASPVFLRLSLLRHEVAVDGRGVSFHFEAVLAAPYRLPESEEKGRS